MPAALSLAEKSLTGMETRPNEIVPEPIARAAMCQVSVGLWRTADDNAAVVAVTSSSTRELSQLHTITLEHSRCAPCAVDEDLDAAVAHPGRIADGAQAREQPREALGSGIGREAGEA